MSAVTIFSRPGCHLCEEAERMLLPLAANAGHELTVVDIEGDDELHKRYLELIPVIEFEGAEISRLDQFRDGRLQKAFAGDRSVSY